jgi:hypothetical protein
MPLRRGIAMIELIFAIVIMGLVLMTAPMMISTATRSSMQAISQESIAIAAAHANALMTYAWDEQNTQGGQLGVLETNSTNTVLEDRAELNNTSGASRARQIGAFAVLDSQFGKGVDPEGNGTEMFEDDLDDFHNTDTNLTVANKKKVGRATNESYEGEYIDQNITIHTEVVYLADSASSPDFSTCTMATGAGCAYSNPAVVTSGTTNVKQFTVKLTTDLNNTSVDEIENKEIILKGFMCNIGSALPTSRGSI